MAVFPPAILKEDSSKFNVEFEDKSIRSETDGGYVYARPRHGRKARRSFSTGFTNINDTQRLALDNFFDTVGTYLIFDYYVPDTGELVAVRFDAPYSWQYRGIGGTHLYDVHDIKLQEV